MAGVVAGRCCLVTGGGRGIGAAIARALAHEGGQVIVAGRGMAALEAVASEINGRAVQLDLLDRAATDKVLADIGPVDILVNNSGIAESAPLDKTDDAMWDRVMELDATAPFRLIRALVPGMVAKKWGRVVNIASNAGVSGYQYTAAYCAAKHAMVGMTRALAMDLGRTGVTINAICPGWVETDMVAEAVARIATTTGRSEEDARKALSSMSPQKRMMQPAEIAHATLMLCAHEGRGIHGQTIVIDGGAVLK